MSHSNRHFDAFQSDLTNIHNYELELGELNFKNLLNQIVIQV